MKSGIKNIIIHRLRRDIGVYETSNDDYCTILRIHEPDVSDIGSGELIIHRIAQFLKNSPYKMELFKLDYPIKIDEKQRFIDRCFSMDRNRENSFAVEALLREKEVQIQIATSLREKALFISLYIPKEKRMDGIVEAIETIKRNTTSLFQGVDVLSNSDMIGVLQYLGNLNGIYTPSIPFTYEFPKKEDDKKTSSFPTLQKFFKTQKQNTKSLETVQKENS